MIGLIGAESRKLFRRLPFWIMLGVLVFFVGITAVFLIVLPRVASDTFGDLPDIPPSVMFTLGLQTALGQTWFPAILAAVMVGGEVGGPVWSSALTLESRRWMHVLAKLIVLTLGAMLAFVVAMVLWVTIVALFVEDGQGPTGLGAVLWKSAVIQLTWVALGIGSVGLFQSMGPAIGVIIGLNVGESLLSIWEPWQLISLSTNQAAVLGDIVTPGGLGAVADIPIGRAAGVVLAWAGVAIVLAVVGLAVRDP